MAKKNQVLIGESLFSHLKDGRISLDQKVLAILARMQKSKNGVQLEDLLNTAKGVGVKPAETQKIVKALIKQRRIRVQNDSIIYPDENYYFWNDNWD